MCVQFGRARSSGSPLHKLRGTCLLSKPLRLDQCQSGLDMYEVGCLIACWFGGNPEQHDYPVVSAECQYDPICCLKLFVLFHHFFVSCHEAKQPVSKISLVFSQDQHQLETWHQRLTCREAPAAGAHFHHFVGLVRPGGRRGGSRCGSAEGWSVSAKLQAVSDAGRCYWLVVSNTLGDG